LATYVITQDDVDAGGVSNTVLADGDSPDGTNVTDVSDDPNDTNNVDPDNDGDPDDPTDTVIPEDPSILAEKSATITDNGDGVLGAGDTINYIITVENTGNVTLNNVGILDTLTDLGGNVLALTTGSTFNGADAGSAEGVLLVDETATYLATYVITQNDVDAGGVSNTVLADGDSPDGTNVTDVSDDPNDTDNVDPDNDGDPDDPTDTVIPEDPIILAEKSATITDNGDGVLGAGDTINYIITVANTGNVTLDGVTITDTFTDFVGNVLILTTGPTFNGADAGSAEGVLLVDETATYLATYVITQNDVDAEGVSNTVLASGDSPDGTNVTDDSDDPNDTENIDPDNDGDPDDPTDTFIESPIILAEKSATITDNGDGVLGAGDTINYIITVENTGNVTLNNVGIADTLTDLDGNILALTAGPIFDSSDAGSTEGTLLVNETVTYLATYVITQDDVDAGGVSNTVLADGDSPDGTNVTDVSDDPNDTENIDPDNDGDPDDPTDTVIPEDPSILAEKSATITDNGDGVIGVDDVINYSITIKNTGNVTLNNVIIIDVFTDIDGNVLTLTTGPTYDSADQGSIEGTLLAGEIATYIATYIITQDDVDVGGVSNSVVAIGDDPEGDTVTDISDDGDDTDGNTDDDSTDTFTETVFELSVIKEVDITQPLIGDNVTFTITVSNEGFVTATGVTVEEFIPSGYTFVSYAATTGTNPDTYFESTGEWVVGQLNPGQVQVLAITVEVLGFGDYLNTASISDFVGGDDQNEDNNTDSAGVDPICLTIYNEFSPNGDGVNDVFVIDCIENYPDNSIEIYNRWGNIVYETKGYRNDFDGTSNGRAVLGEGDKLPVGTYYYVIDLGNGSEPRVGWLYINR
ncbi:DUF11 domain-containing protein, partial [Psychroserpens burtonensis]